MTDTIIFVTEERPFPARGGGAMRDLAMLNLLTERASVDLVCFAGAHGATTAPRRVAVTEVARARPSLWSRLLAPLRPYVANGYSAALARVLREKAAPGRVVWVSRLTNAKYIGLARKLGFRVVLDEHNVESGLLKALAPLSASRVYARWMAWRCAAFESKACAAADVVVATSERDQAALKRLAPGARVDVLPNCVDVQEYAPLRGRAGATLLFVGTLDYFPNFQGLAWFAAEVLPELRAVLGVVRPRIVVAGARPTPVVAALCRENGFELKSDPDSVFPLLGDAAAVFVPLRSGGGTRVKIIEALAAGRVVVSTSKGAEGLLIRSDRDCLIGDDPKTFAGHLARALIDVGAQKRLADQAALTADTHYDWRRSRDAMAAILAPGGSHAVDS